MIPFPFCRTCLGTGTLYHTEWEPAGWVAIFEPCPRCRPNDTAAFTGRPLQVSTRRGEAS